MNVLILGSGGREHAFAHKINQSPLLDKLFIMPGNAGTEKIAMNIKGSINDFESVKNIVIKYDIQLVVVGPEEPLVRGIHDFFINDNILKNIAIIGPQKQGATLEGSKDFAKKFMFRHHIPTAKYDTFDANNISECFAFLETMSPPFVIKADGLAAGKGVLILEDIQQAKQEIEQILLYSKFGTAGNKVVIEEFLFGIEASCFVLTNGEEYKILPTAKDYKRIGEGDTGLNTGGMGAVSPPPFIDSALMQKIEERVVRPSVEGLKKDNIPYIGFLFIGLMIINNEPYVIEYNVRMGDPETQVVLPRIQSDLLALLQATYDGTMSDHQLEITDNVTATVVMVAGGYPEHYQKGDVINGLDTERNTNTTIYHAGTKNVNGQTVTNGGRVLAVSSINDNFINATKTSFETIKSINFKDAYYRKDIGFDL